jgi:hypothetical protein
VPSSSDEKAAAQPYVMTRFPSSGFDMAGRERKSAQNRS